MNVCRICLEEIHTADACHANCLRGLFGSAQEPTLDIEVSKLHTAALAMVGHTSLSGVQKKISVNLSADRQTLAVAAAGGLYILKPQTDTYPALPENEHVTTRLADLSGLSVAAAGLVVLKDKSLAYVVKRFDRLPEGGKVRQEDFCQLSELPPKEKYAGSAELCVRVLRKYASEPLIEIRKLFQWLVFGWWSGNGDMHLKNFSLLTDEEGITRLTPAYDLVCTQLVIPDDPLALPINGKETNVRRGDWLKLAEYCGLPPTVARQILDKQLSVTSKANALIEQSYLPEEQKRAYLQLIEKHNQDLLESS